MHVVERSIRALREALAAGEVQCPNCETRFALDLSDDTVDADEDAEATDGPGAADDTDAARAGAEDEADDDDTQPEDDRVDGDAQLEDDGDNDDAEEASDQDQDEETDRA